MLRFPVLLAVLGMLVAGPLASQEPILSPDAARAGLTRREREEILRVYARAQSQPDWLARLDQFDAADRNVRHDAARWLAGLLAWTWADERRDDAPWHVPGKPPSLGVGRRAPSLVRDWLEKTLQRRDCGAAVIPALRMWVRHGIDTNDRATALRIARRLRTPETGRLVADVIADPATRPRIVEEALTVALILCLPIDAAVLRSRAMHDDHAVRSVARRVIEGLGQPVPPPLVEASVATSPGFRVPLVSAGRTIPWRPRTDARFVRVCETEDDGSDPIVRYGWCTDETPTSIAIYTPEGAWYDFTKSVRLVVDTVDPLAEVERIRAYRAAVRGSGSQLTVPPGFAALNWDLDYHLVSRYEIAFARWLLDRGERRAAARALEPALACLADADRDLPRAARAMFGKALLDAIADAFVWRCDDALTAERARIAVRTQPDSDVGRLARRLLDELARDGGRIPRRLPTLDAWTELSRSLDRDERIRYLASRLSRITALGHGHWSGHRLDETQYDRPPIAIRALYETDDSNEAVRRAEVINPFVLLGGESIALTHRDVPLLLAGFEEPRFTRVARDFPEWQFATTDEPLTRLVNEAAGFPLIDEAFLALEPSARGSEIADIVAWCQAHEDRAEPARIAAGMQRWIARGAQPWSAGESALVRLAQFGGPHAGAIFAAIAARYPYDRFKLQRCVSLATEADTAAALRATESWLAHESPMLRFYAGCIRVENGAVHAGRDAIADGFRFARRVGPGVVDAARAVRALLADGTTESIAVARLAFVDGEPLRGDRPFDDHAILDAFAEAGLPDAHRYFLRHVDRVPPANAIRGHVASWSTPHGTIRIRRLKEMRERTATRAYGRRDGETLRACLVREIAAREAAERAKRQR